VKQEQSPLTQKNSDEKQAENCLRQLNLPIKSTITTSSCRSVPTALKPSSPHPTTRLACACLAAMLLAAGLESAGAEQWYPPVTYDQGGTNPKVAGGQWGLEVHQGVSAPGTLPLYYPLWARAGDYSDNGPFQDSYLYDYGTHPTVTEAFVPAYELPPGLLRGYDPIFVEMHQATVNVSELMYRITDPNGTRLDPHPAIDMREMGFNPSIAANGSTVVQVHQALNGSGPLWYRVGTVNRAQTAPYPVSLTWSNSSLQYDWGANPFVTFLDSTHVLEVHQGVAGGATLLWYRIGFLEGTYILWQDSVAYGYGSTPSVSSVGGEVILEVHGHAGVDTGLYYQVASASGQSPFPLRLNFGPASLYSYGLTPSLAAGIVSGNPRQGGNYSENNIEVHQNGNALQTQVWGQDYTIQ
jgi:hypothetical protein